MWTKRIAVKQPNTRAVMTVHLFAAVLLGVFYAVSVIGREPINPAETTWILNGSDPSQHFLSWQIYRQDESWSWPLTMSRDLGYPGSVSIAYTDSIPILALVGKLLSGWLPEQFQYFGVFILASFILHTWFGLRLMYLLFGGKTTESIIAAAILLLAPPLTWRLHGHIALTAHWLVLWSFYLYFKAEDVNCRRSIGVQQLILMFICTGIHPYLAVMVLLFCMATWARWWLCQGLPGRVALSRVGLLLFETLLGWWFFGYLTESDGYSQGGLGMFSMNSLSPFNSSGFSTFLPAIPQATTGQYEGFNYLGLGVLLMLAATAPLLYRHIGDLFKPSMLPGTIVFFALAIISLSTVVTFGPWTLFTLPISQDAIRLAEVFRCTGRFFWPVHYGIVVGLMTVISRSFSRRNALLMLLALVAIQYVDLAPLRESATAWMKTPFARKLTSPEWTKLHVDHRKLIVLPAWQCEEFLHWKETMLIAAEQNLATNNYYSARFGSEHRKLHCLTSPLRLRSNGFEADAAYVLRDDIYLELANSGAITQTHSCERVDGFILCTSAKDGHPKRLALKELIVLAPADGVIEFSHPPDAMFLAGWTPAGSDGTLTSGDARFAFRLSDDQIFNIRKMEIQLFGFVPFDELEYELRHGQRLLANGLLTPSHLEATIIVDVPHTDDGVLLLSLSSSRLFSPVQAGVSDDKRQFGVGIRRIRLLPHSEEP